MRNPIPPPLTSYFIAGLLVAAFFLGYRYHNRYIADKVEGFISSYEKSNAHIAQWINRTYIVKNLDESRLNVFKAQFNPLSERKTHHKELAKYFLSNYYASLLVLMFSSISGGIVIFLIAQKGWANSTNNIKAVFFSLFFATTFWGLFPGVFSQSGNYQGNLRKYILYDNIQVEIFNHLSTDATLNMNGEPIKSDSLITMINKRIIDMNDIIISFDESKIGTIDEISKLIGKTSNSQ